MKIDPIPTKIIVEIEKIDSASDVDDDDVVDPDVVVVEIGAAVSAQIGFDSSLFFGLQSTASQAPSNP